ncbi:sensor histidine kinase [Oceaniglobus trochenteri]|uniref:sensor histidine kinase n=1 Tax=Oceaniglobus trochenteri TaxID=2763260 RepID=UPI001CFF88D2|nr:ATP-binding protein [Oceaniglobus trochenteri]
MDNNDIQIVLDALQLPAFLVDHEERITVSNAPARRLLGGALRGGHYAAVLRQPQILEAIETVIAGGGPARASFATSSGARETIWMASAAALSAGGRQGVLVSLEDTTEMLEAGQMRRDFVANVSHELRTPLTALIGFIDTLRGAARDDAAARDRFLSIMEREANRMNRLVKDLLSLSRVESEERMRPTGRLDMGELLRSVIQSLTPLVGDHGQRIELTGADDLPAISGDGDQLRQVFTNLIENAAKYGARDETVTVAVQVLARDPSLRCAALQIDVVDRGEGIDPIHLPRLTERFYRIDDHRSREKGGTGLGLAIVKHIVNRHRGRLRISSTPGEGSRFSVLLPLAGD